MQRFNKKKYKDDKLMKFSSKDIKYNANVMAMLIDDGKRDALINFIMVIR
jgi:hypothetical protein